MDILGWLWWGLSWVLTKIWAFVWWLFMGAFGPILTVLALVALWLLYKRGPAAVLEMLRRTFAALEVIAGVRVVEYMPAWVRTRLPAQLAQSGAAERVIEYRDREVRVYTPSLWQKCKLFLGGGVFWVPCTAILTYVLVQSPK